MGGIIVFILWPDLDTYTKIYRPVRLTDRITNNQMIRTHDLNKSKVNTFHELSINNNNFGIYWVKHKH